MMAWMLCLLSTITNGTPVCDHVDRIQVNHFYDEHHHPVFSQLIFEDRRRDGSYVVVDWRLIKDSHRPATIQEQAAWDADVRRRGVFWTMQAGAVWVRRFPELKEVYEPGWKHPYFANGLWRVTWFDGSLMRSVTADSFWQTWTNHDPELRNRDLLPKEWRRGLSSISQE